MSSVFAVAVALFAQEAPPPRVDLQASCDLLHDLHLPSAPGRLVVFGSRGYAAAFDIGRGIEGRLPLAVGEDIHAVAADARSGRLYLAGKDGLVRAFDPGAKEPSALFPDDELWADQALRAVALSPDGRLLAAGGQSRRVRLYDTETKKELKPFTASGGVITALAFTADGNLLAVANDRGRIHLVDPRKPETARELKGHADRVTDVAIHDAAKLIYSASVDGTLRSFDLATGAEKRKLEPVEGPILGIELAPEARPKPLLLVVGAKGQVLLLDAADGSKVRELERRPEVTALRMDAAGRTVALAVRGGAVAFYSLDREAGAPPVPPPPPASAVKAEAPENYATLGARLGMLLKPAGPGRAGFVVERMLLGFVRNPKGPQPGDVITHFWEGVYLPLTETGFPAAGTGTISLRVRDAQGRDREATATLYGVIDVLARQRDVDALINGGKLYYVGMTVDRDGTVRRADPGPAADVGIRVGDRIVTVKGEPWSQRPLARPHTADPIELGVESAGQTRKIVLTPWEWTPSMRDTTLGRWLVEAGREEEGRKLIERAKSRGDR